MSPSKHCGSKKAKHVCLRFGQTCLVLVVTQKVSLVVVFCNYQSLSHTSYDTLYYEVLVVVESPVELTQVKYQETQLPKLPISMPLLVVVRSYDQSRTGLFS